MNDSNNKRITIAQVNQSLQRLSDSLLGDGVNKGFIQDTKDRLESIELRLAKEFAPSSDISQLKSDIKELQDKIEHLKDAHQIAIDELRTKIWKAITATAFIMGSAGFGLGSWIF